MKDFTTSRQDGFGAQLNAMLVGFLVARQYGCEYFYTPMACLKLLKVGYQNKQLDRVNNVLAHTMRNLGVKHATGGTYILPRPENLYPHCNEETFRGSSVMDLKYAWPLSSPHGRKTVVIHVRRGGDIDPSHEHRWQSRKFVNDIVRRCTDRYPFHKIKVLC